MSHSTRPAMSSGDTGWTSRSADHNHHQADLMSDSIQAGQAGVGPDNTSSTKALRNLYYVRFGFAVVWAILLLLTAHTINPVAIVLLIIYPVFDVAAAVIDFRSSGSSRTKAPLYINMGLSLLTALGLAAVIGFGIPDVLRVWGAWAITAGIVQLIVAILRYRLGGQWAMILSGGISVIAGSGFIVMAGGPNAALTGIGGYAILGGIFFLISAIRLHRVIAKAAD